MKLPQATFALPALMLLLIMPACAGEIPADTAGPPPTIINPSATPPAGGATPAPTLAETPLPALSAIAPTPTISFDPSGLSASGGGRFVPLDDPTFIAADSATYLAPDDFVLGIEFNGEARAYPVAMMAYHHLANDSVRGSPLLVTY